MFDNAISRRVKKMFSMNFISKNNETEFDSVD